MVRAFLSGKPVLIGAWAIDRGNGSIEETEIHCELTPVVVPMVQHQGPPNTHSWPAAKFLVTIHQTPVRLRRFFRGFVKRLFYIAHSLLKRSVYLVHTVRHWRVEVALRNVEGVWLCDFGYASEDRGNMQRQLAQ